MSIRRRTRMLMGIGALLGFWTTGCHSTNLGMRPSGLLEVAVAHRKAGPSAEILRPRIADESVAIRAQGEKAAVAIDPPIVQTSAIEDEMPAIVASNWQPLSQPGTIEPAGILDLVPEPQSPKAAASQNAQAPVATTPLRAADEPEPLQMPRPAEKGIPGHTVSMSAPHGGSPAHAGGHHQHGIAGVDGAPREGAKTPLPPYIIEPPDLLLVQLVGRKPETLPQPISGSFLVRQDGTISLGVYGTVKVVGLTLDDAKGAIAARLATRLKERDELDEKGEKTGKKIPLTDELVVDIDEYASKYCYLIADGGGNGASVVRIPINGSDTVLDAFSKVGGLPAQTWKKKIWVARTNPHYPSANQLLPVDWMGIAMRGDVSTNYQMFPGDRIFVQSDPRIRANSQLDKTLNPVERVLGVTLLGSSVVNSIKSGGRGNNSNNNN